MHSVLSYVAVLLIFGVNFLIDIWWTNRYKTPITEISIKIKSNVRIVADVWNTLSLHTNSECFCDFNNVKWVFEMQTGGFTMQVVTISSNHLDWVWLYRSTQRIRSSPAEREHDGEFSPRGNNLHLQAYFLSSARLSLLLV